MAAVRPSSRQHHPRRRSASDPFVDPAPQRNYSNPPPPPPKSAQSARPSRAPPAKDITEAVRETVTVRAQESATRKMGRSQTGAT